MKQAAAAVPMSKKAISNKRKDAWFGFAITAPSILLLLLLFLFPIVYSLVLSFTNYNYVKGTGAFVGFRNYVTAFSDPDFLNSLKVTFLISIISVIVQFIFGILLSLFTINIQKGQGLFKTTFLIPQMVAPTVAGLLFRFMFNQEFGIVNSALKAMGLQPVSWLVDPNLAVFSVVLTDSWTCIPFVFLLVYTAFASLPQDMLEAGRIDGGNAWQIFFRIQLPNVRGALMVTLVLRFMDVFRIYDSIYIMTKGGPGTATEALSLYIYRVNWSKYQMGKASALSYIMMVIMAIIGILINYYSEDKYDRKMRRALKKGAVKE